MSDRTILTIVYNSDGQPVPGATVKIDDATLHTGTTDASGFCPLQVSAIPASHLWITAPGYIDYSHHLDLPLTNVQIRVGYPPDPDRPTDVLLPPLQATTPTPDPGTIRPLTSEGVTIRDVETGDRVSLCGYDQFTALHATLHGTDLTPFITETQAIGFNMWRVFGEASSTENGYYTLDPHTPGYYDALDSLAQQLHTAGIYLLFTTYADNQVLHCSLEHWYKCAEVLRPYQEGVFLSGGNQYQKNGWDPYGLPDPHIKWWSRGSSTEDDQNPVPPNGATFAEFHPRRDYPKALDDTVASATNLQYTKHFNVPLLITEPPRMGEDGSGTPYLDPQICWQFARHYSTQCAGAVLHMRPGQKGTLIDPNSACDRIAAAWVAAFAL